jgi:hypothetical protein
VVLVPGELVSERRPMVVLAGRFEFLVCEELALVEFGRGQAFERGDIVRVGISGGILHFLIN